ncbi:GNAT family N-acetyltransferase [Limnohabitans sp. DM1]|uniref:GNAT family N-acetyltransferase n=1 Tax=Limnohabitans sp. DM1 TaxID=1597955 RepID=UPI000B0C8E50|nr:GNAT family protein [Limnohabitans sp. DM1]
MVDFPTLQTSRLTLREIVESDAENILQIHGNAEYMRWFGSDPIRDLDGATKLVATFASWRKEPVSGARWALELKDQAGLIGTCGLFRWNRNWKSCIVGYEIAAAHQGRGYVKEALIAIITWGFREVQLNRIEAQVHPDNSASLALLEALGFQQEGRQREAGYWAGQHHDLLQYALLNGQWRTENAV